MSEQRDGLRVGIDFDNVLFDTDWLKMTMACVLFPSPSRRLALNQTPEAMQLTAEEDAVLETILYSSEHSTDRWLSDWEEYWGELLPVAGARPYVRQLSQEGHSLFVVTRRGSMGVSAAKILLQKWDIGDFERVVGVGPNMRKDLAAAVLELDVMVDDSLAVLEGLEGVVPHRLLFDQPDNQGAVLGEGITRVLDWDAIYHYIGSVVAERAEVLR